jgi:hypothetical protein
MDTTIRNERRAARARRIRRIRRGVAAGGMTIFLAAWGVVYTQGSTGTSSASPTPAVAAQVDTAATTTAAATTAASTTDNTSSSSQVSAVTTQQS